MLEKLLPKKKQVTESVTPEHTVNSAYLKGLKLLQQQHAATRQKPQSAAQNSEKEKSPQPLSLVQKITTTIAEAVAAVIDTIGNYISRIFS